MATPPRKTTSPSVPRSAVTRMGNGNDVADPPAPDSPEQAEMIEAGARPIQFDEETQRALMDQIAAMQRQLDALQAERKIAAGDPVSDAVFNLRAHVIARRAGSSDIEADELSELLELMNENDSDGITPNDCVLARELVDEMMERYPGKELAYLRTLARDLHKAVLTRDV